MVSPALLDKARHPAQLPHRHHLSIDRYLRAALDGTSNASLASLSGSD
jgi:hypothetical protein